MVKPVNSLRDQIEGFRDQIATLRVERRKVERALPDRRQALAAIERWQREAQARIEGQVDTASLLRPADGRPAIGARVDLSQAAAAMAARELADLHRDAVEAAFVAAGNDGLDTEARAAKIASIDAEILAAGKGEEAAIRAAEVAGTPILRRADADPRIVLARDCDLKVERTPSPTPDRDRKSMG